MSVFLAALDITIVTTALPTISDHFQSASGYVWVGSTFLLAAAALTPTWGKLSDIWGRKAILLIAGAVFFLGSALCGAAISVAMLVAGRAVQGAGAGGLLALTNIIIGDLFSQRLVWDWDCVRKGNRSERLATLQLNITLVAEFAESTTGLSAWCGQSLRPSDPSSEVPLRRM
jgi:MFS family permease